VEVNIILTLANENYQARPLLCDDVAYVHQLATSTINIWQW